MQLVMNMPNLQPYMDNRDKVIHGNEGSWE